MCGLVRCEWAGSSPDMLAYHDQEWGVPLHDDRRLFELLILEGAQAGLNWAIVLRKRPNYVAAFHAFDPDRIAAYDEADVARLLADAGIIRNRKKIEAAIANARAFLAVRDEFGSFDRYIWGFVGGAPIRHGFQRLGELPPQTVESQSMSRDLIRRGFRFVGPTICYAFMQAAGLVNDHTTDCFRYSEM